MSHTIYFTIPLVCTNCHSLNPAESVGLYTQGLGRDVGDIRLYPGEETVIDDLDLEESYFVLRPPAGDDSGVIAIEEWGCNVCNKVQSVRLHFAKLGGHRYRFEGGTIVSLSRETLDEANFISRQLNDWSPNPGDDVARVEALREQLMKPA